VPEGDALLIEAKLPISEIGYVMIGAPARLSIASGGSGFSTIPATVVHISPDSLSDEKTGAPSQGGGGANVSYYIVRLEPKELAFRRGGADSYALRPGVQIMAAIITGERSVLDLLLEPFIGSGIRPLTER
jgi:adhesin transport system membrane fusion protein